MRKRLPGARDSAARTGRGGMRFRTRSHYLTYVRMRTRPTVRSAAPRAGSVSTYPSGSPYWKWPWPSNPRCERSILAGSGGWKSPRWPWAEATRACSSSAPCSPPGQRRCTRSCRPAPRLAATPGWTELILMWPNRVGGIAATCAEAFRPYSPVLANLTGVCYWWGWVPTCGLTALLSARRSTSGTCPVPIPVLAVIRARHSWRSTSAASVRPPGWRSRSPRIGGAGAALRAHPDRLRPRRLAPATTFHL